jgi:hypothetical protein
MSESDEKEEQQQQLVAGGSMRGGRSEQQSITHSLPGEQTLTHLFPHLITDCLLFSLCKRRDNNERHAEQSLSLLSAQRNIQGQGSASLIDCCFHSMRDGDWPKSAPLPNPAWPSFC